MTVLNRLDQLHWLMDLIGRLMQTGNLGVLLKLQMQ